MTTMAFAAGFAAGVVWLSLAILTALSILPHVRVIRPAEPAPPAEPKAPAETAARRVLGFSPGDPR